MDNDEIFKFLMRDEKTRNKYENQSMFMALVTLLEDKGIISKDEFDRYLESSKKIIKEKMVKDVPKGRKDYIELREWLEIDK